MKARIRDNPAGRPRVRKRFAHAALITELRSVRRELAETSLLLRESETNRALDYGVVPLLGPLLVLLEVLVLPLAFLIRGFLLVVWRREPSAESTGMLYLVASADAEITIKVARRVERRFPGMRRELFIPAGEFERYHPLSEAWNLRLSGDAVRLFQCLGLIRRLDRLRAAAGVVILDGPATNSVPKLAAIFGGATCVYAYNENGDGFTLGEARKLASHLSWRRRQGRFVLFRPVLECLPALIQLPFRTFFGFAHLKFPPEGSFRKGAILATAPDHLILRIVEAVRKRYPTITFTIYAREYQADMLRRAFPETRIEIIAGGEGRHPLRLLKSIWRERYDLCVALFTGDSSFRRSRFLACLGVGRHTVAYNENVDSFWWDLRHGRQVLAHIRWRSGEKHFGTMLLRPAGILLRPLGLAITVIRAVPIAMRYRRAS